MSDPELIERYRFPRETILMLTDLVNDDVGPKTERSHSIPTHIQVLSTLRYLSKGDFFSEIGDIHGISRSSVSLCIRRVTDAICKNLDNITFPTDAEAINQMKKKFYDIAAFPNVVGCIDGTQIPIQGMSSDEEPLFVCRKGFHSINVQAVVDADMRFINLVCKYPGSTHDSFILMSSGLPDILSNLGNTGWLLGDSGYPLREWLMTPFSNPSNNKEQGYNSSHIRTRNLIERAFGVLKARFRCLHKRGGFLLFKPGHCCKVIECAFKLHNVAVTNEIPLLADVEADPDTDTEEVPSYDMVTGQNTRATQIRDQIARRF